MIWEEELIGSDDRLGHGRERLGFLGFFLWMRKERRLLKNLVADTYQHGDNVVLSEGSRERTPRETYSMLPGNR